MIPKLIRGGENQDDSNLRNIFLKFWKTEEKNNQSVTTFFSKKVTK